VIQLIIKTLVCAAFAVPIALLLGALYVSLAVLVVNVFRLNYGERPTSMHVLNLAVALTALSYFIVFSALLARAA
jgi:hypothetical protein